jgi:hypothetical protein
MYSLKLLEKVGIDKDGIRGMGLVVSTLEPDTDASANLNSSSPSKLDSWLKSGPIKRSAEPKPDYMQDEHFEDQDVSHSSVQHNTVPLPTFSQLDPEVLTELPEDILKEVQSIYGKNKQSAQISTPLYSYPFDSPKSKRSKRTEKHITIPGQVSVKRMLKLASVKSGEDKLLCANKDFTLSQLDCLPLETQLQIANNDQVTVSKTTPPKTTSDSCRNKPTTVHRPDRSFESDLGYEDNSTTTLCDLFRNSRGFYNENILPLQEFIKSTPHPENHDVQSVIEFLFVCLEERRLEDVIVFLRTIKNMQHGWDNNVYDQVKESVVGEVRKLNGYFLDTDWLGL